MLKVNLYRIFLMLVLVTATISIGTPESANAATTKDELTTDANQALALLIKNNPKAAELAKHAKAALIFPNIVKAGFVFGGAYGEGVLEQQSKIDSYYNSVTASWGLQIGAQTYGYVVFLMNDNAVKYIKNTKNI